jgi:hypothetical protein
MRESKKRRKIDWEKRKKLTLREKEQKNESEMDFLDSKRRKRK